MDQESITDFCPVFIACLQILCEPNEIVWQCRL